MVHAHRPADERRLGARVGPRGAAHQLRRQPGDLGHSLGRVLADRLSQRLETGRVALDVVAIDEVVLDHEVNEAVDEREIGARAHRQMEVGHHRRLRDPRIDDDERGAGIGAEAPAENRVVLRDVRADQQNDVGALEILVGSRRSVAAERALVALHRRGHAERGVAVVVRRAEAKLHQLAHGVELFGHQLTGADHADGAGAVARLHVAEARRHRRQRVVPGHALHRAAAAQQRIARTIVSADCVVLGQALRTQHPAIDGMIGVAADRHGAAVLDADEHPAAHRAVATGRRDPSIGNLLRRDIARDRIDAVGVAIGAGVESKHLLEGHAASLADAI